MSKIIKEDPSWVTKYNGFNNGKDASAGIGGQRIPLQIKTMSKTKEEILQHHYIHGKGLTHPEYVQNAMEEYAAQVLSEYKEKLKAEIKKDIDYYESIKLTEYGEGHLVGLKDIQKLINGPL